MTKKISIKSGVHLFILTLFTAGVILLTTSCASTSNKNTQPVTANNTLSTTQAVISDGYGAKGALADTDLNVTDMMIYAVQDEYLAHGEYAAIIEKFGSQAPYSNIIKSEEEHLSMLKELFAAYSADFPKDSSAEHVVIPADLLQAASTGVQAEIDNIAMYEHFLTFDLPADVRDVFVSLRDASKNHLASFQKQVDKLS